MDGALPAAFEATTDFLSGHSAEKSRFVAQPGMTAPDGRSGFQGRAPLALVVPLRRPEQAAPEPGPSADVAMATAVADPPSVVQPPVMPRPVQPSAAQLAETRAMALAEGRAQGIAETETALQAERDSLAAQARALAAALARLQEPPLAEVDALTQSIAGAVARLASERAGQLIDLLPDPFARRIAHLAERVSQCMRDVTIHLHPDDLEAISPLLAQACPPELSTLAAARLVADCALSRGDADLRAPGLRLADLSVTPEPMPRPIKAELP